MPGVNNASTQAAGPTTASFNGGQTFHNEVYLEGVPLTSAGTQGDTRYLAFAVSVEAVDQFQVETNSPKAQYQGQGVENYVLKSGANAFHGAAFEYFRNTALDARGFFPKARAIDHQNEYGGPVTLRDALAHSRNIVAIKVAQETGLERVAALWKKVGVGSEAKPYPSMALGVFEASPLDMTTAYTIFTNQGAVRPLHAMARIVQDGKGREIGHRGAVAGAEILKLG